MTLVSILILMAFATSLLINIRTSSFPFSAYGVTLRNWQPAAKEALLFSLPVAGLMVLGKWLLISTVPAMAGQPLLDLFRSEPAGLSTALLLALVYAVFVPVQEFSVRTVQSALLLYLQGRFRILLSLLIPTLLFSAMHLHNSFRFAVVVFPLGLFWGWLYLRNPTLVGVVLSHLALGLFALRIVGFPI